MKGNTNRLIVKFNFDYQLALIRFIGKQAEYENLPAGQGRVSEIMNKKRKLTLDMIRKLSSSLKIPQVP